MPTLIERSRRIKFLPILIVEDDADEQVFFKHSLAAYEPDLKLIFANSAEEALAYLTNCLDTQAYLPQLIFMDLYLPQPDMGWDLLKEIKALYPNMPVIVLSADDSEATIRRAYEMSANSFIRKPALLNNWERTFRNLCDYWMNTVTLSPVF